MKIPIVASIATLALTLAPIAQADSIHLLTPCRFLDTRDEVPLPGISGPMANGRFYRIQGQCGVAWDAKGVLVNVTVVGATVSGHLSLVASMHTPGEGSFVPTTSVLNFEAGKTAANFAIVALTRISTPADADILVYPHVPGGEVHVILDVVGYLK
jgi:hypothetical protein